jgi:FG-GAP repeat protein
MIWNRISMQGADVTQSAMTRVLALTLSWVIAAATGLGQELLFEVNGDSAYAGFGSFVAEAGDVNADGYPDLIVGIPYEPKGSIVPGNVRVVSGHDGALLYSKYGSSDGELFGVAVAGGFDMNQDGYADFLVGAPNAVFGSARRALLYSGKDRTILWSADGDDAQDGFGYAVASCGDVNQDGTIDWVVGATGGLSNGVRVGFARVFSGLDGSVLNTIYGSETNASFGSSVSSAGDVDADGYNDIIVGSPYSSVARLHGGRALVYSGSSGALILDEKGDSKDELYLGWSVSDVGDLDLDGFGDILVGTLQYDTDNCPSSQGFAWVYSGQTGGVLYQYQGDASDDVFGISVHGCGDVNGDGWLDFVIGAPQTSNTGRLGGCGGDPGYARLFSGRTGLVLYTFAGRNVNDNFGIAVSKAGDVNRDGLPDLAVGAVTTIGGSGKFGSVYVFGGNDLFLNAAPRDPTAGDVITLSTREGPTGNPVALFMVDLNGTPTSALLGLGSFDSSLGFVVSGTVPAGLSGYDITLKSFAIGASGKVIDSAPEVVTIQ